MALRLVAFDFDGVLADTEPLHCEAKRVKVGRLGGRGDVLDPLAYVGRANREYWQDVAAALGLPHLDVAEAEREQYNIIIQLARQRQMGPTRGLAGVLAFLRGRGVKLAVASSSDRFYLEEMVPLLGLAGQFDFMVGGDEIPRKKPAPDVYLRALELAGAAAGEALAVEDSAAGLAAARAAGYFTVGYKNPTSGPQDISAADAAIGDFNEMRAILCQRLEG